MYAYVENPYFNGKIGGIQFHQHAGGARAKVTTEQAAVIKAKHPSVQIVLEEGDEPAEEAATPQLSDITGIGKATLKKLVEAGVETTQQLLEADSDELAEKTGLRQADIEAWQKSAAE